MFEMSASQLLALSQTQLDRLFRESMAGDLPDGPVDGTAMIAPGMTFARIVARLIRRFTWQGKLFDARRGLVRNRISPVGLFAVLGEVYRGSSWLDGRPCIVLDYTKTSHLGRWVRDEVRDVTPGLYMGRAYWRKYKVLNFAMQSLTQPSTKRRETTFIHNSEGVASPAGRMAPSLSR